MRLQVLHSLFLSTLSLRRATIMFAGILPHHSNFYPRSPCGERLYYFDFSRLWRDFYPRSPCGERLSAAPPARRGHWPFLSTLSLRRATRYFSMPSWNTSDFYPRSPCGERPRGRQPALSQSSISIHALLAESDPSKLAKTSRTEYISIHALLAESDTYLSILF